MKYASLILSAALLGISACASTSAYRPAASATAPGYSETALENNRYRVAYRLAGRDAGQAQDYALLRAAELTLQKGYSTFEIVSRSADAVRETDPAPEFATGPDYAVSRSCGLLTCTTTARPVMPARQPDTRFTRDEVVVTLEILMSHKDAETSASLYNASRVMSSLRKD